MTMLQASVWKNAINPAFETPNPAQHGWMKKGGNLEVLWMTKEPAQKAIFELLSGKTCKQNVIPKVVDAKACIYTYIHLWV